MAGVKGRLLIKLSEWATAGKLITSGGLTQKKPDAKERKKSGQAGTSLMEGAIYKDCRAQGVKQTNKKSRPVVNRCLIWAP